MAEELDLETYLCISPNEFEIYLFNKTNLKNLYEDKIRFNNNSDYFNFNLLDKFLEKNIFKIEKFAGNFIKNIFLIIDNKEIKEVNFGIKKKSYENIIGKNFLQNILTDAKDLFRENYQEQEIMHMIINKYYFNGKSYPSFDENFKCDYLALEIQFRFVSKNIIYDLNKILENYQIKIIKYLDGNYVKNIFDDDLELSEMSHKILHGHNLNEVMIVPKNTKKLAFFVKFFQLFS